MFNQLFSRMKRFFGRKQNADSFELIRLSVSEEVIREKMKGVRDFKIKFDLDGTISAYCKSCDCLILTKEGKGLLWFMCPKCRRVSFCPNGNIKRDVHFSIQDGKPLEYELYYMKDLPPVLRPPF